MKKLTTEDFIEKAKSVHGDKYDYSKSIYTSSLDLITIICPIHGEFSQAAQSHYGKKYGCQKCCKQHQKNINFISDAKKIHNNKYDYSLVEYINNKVKVKIICPEHGVFEQRPDCHLTGRKCYKCSKNSMVDKIRKPVHQFINECNLIHNYKYDYSLVEYKGSFKKVKIICKIHGVFNQKPHDHLGGCGCPICKSSKGGLTIKEWLDSNNIKYVQEYKYNDCRNILPLPFDFYLPDHNMCIEYDGKQHHKVNYFFGGENGLKETKKRDKIKDIYCIDNNILLLRIRYDEIIVDELNKVLNQKNN
jgi:very-short-patch-repair endonuclease